MKALVGRVWAQNSGNCCMCRLKSAAQDVDALPKDASGLPDVSEPAKDEQIQQKGFSTKPPSVPHFGVRNGGKKIGPSPLWRRCPAPEEHRDHGTPSALRDNVPYGHDIPYGDDVEVPPSSVHRPFIVRSLSVRGTIELQSRTIPLPEEHRGHGPQSTLRGLCRAPVDV